jgi:hypothetical protein
MRTLVAFALGSALLLGMNMRSANAVTLSPSNKRCLPLQIHPRHAKIAEGYWFTIKATTGVYYGKKCIQVPDPNVTWASTGGYLSSTSGSSTSFSSLVRGKFRVTATSIDSPSETVTATIVVI